MIIVDKKRMTAKVIKRPIVSMVLLLTMAIIGANGVYVSVNILIDADGIYSTMRGAFWFLVSLHVLYYGIRDFLSIAKAYLIKE